MAAAACMACGRRTALKAGTPSSLPAGECAATAKLSVPYPEIPTYLNGEEEEAGYVLMHFWDGVDFSDESWTEAAETMEEAFARFITVASLYPDMELSKQAVARLMQRLGEEAVPDVYDLMTGLADKYLYDPNSPLRNEELYITVLEEQIADPDLEDIYKVAPREAAPDGPEEQTGRPGRRLFLHDRKRRTRHPVRHRRRLRTALFPQSGMPGMPGSAPGNRLGNSPGTGGGDAGIRQTPDNRPLSRYRHGRMGGPCERNSRHMDKCLRRSAGD